MINYVRSDSGLLDQWKRITLLFLFLILTTTVHGQNGPGGVGTADGASSLTLWLDASQINGTNGLDIGGWPDLSGYDNNAGIGTNAPSYSSLGGGNGQPSVSFLAGDQENLVVPGSAEVLPSTALSVFVAGTFDAGSDDYASFVNTASDLNWLDGWGIDGEFGEIYFFTDWSGLDGVGWCGIGSGLPNPAINNIYGLIHESGANSAYESELSCSFGNSPLTYNGGSAGNNLLIGAGPDNNGAGYFMTGDIEEVIIFNAALNDAERIILTNYLSAKYDIPLDANDVYQQDNDNANGNYDFDVAGIGQSPNDDVHFDARGTGIVRMSGPSEASTDEFLLWGHNGAPLTPTETGDTPLSVVARVERVWRVSERKTTGAVAELGTVDIRFDLTGIEPDQASDLRLLVDIDNNGLFDDAPLTVSAKEVGGGIYQFDDVDALDDSLRFSIGTANTILPIDLIVFHASVTADEQVRLSWATASEKNNDFFTIERSIDTDRWQQLLTKPGAGTSSERRDYVDFDERPWPGLSYYRLKQTDFDGQFSYSQIVSLIADLGTASPALYPNPATSELILENFHKDPLGLTIYDLTGKDVSGQVIIHSSKPEMKIGIDISDLPVGVYVVRYSGEAVRFIKDHK